MTSIILAMVLSYPPPPKPPMPTDWTGLYPGDVLLVYNRGEITDQMDHCRGRPVGEMHLLDRKTGAFQVCVDFGGDTTNRYWLELPRKPRGGLYR